VPGSGSRLKNSLDPDSAKAWIYRRIQLNPWSEVSDSMQK
jgi:hypothetical protein